MKRSKVYFAWLVGAVLILTVPIPEKAQSAPQDIVVTEKDNGKDITLHGDQRLIIRLTSPGGPAGWSALMTPDSILAFTAKPEPEQKKQPDSKAGAVPMVGGSRPEEFAFRAARFSESSTQWFALIFCTAQCDLKDGSAKVFKLGIMTKKN